MDLGAITGIWALMPGFLLVLARVGACILAAPLIGGPYVPNQVKVLLTVALAAILFRQAPVMAPDLRWILALGREVLVGLALGFVVNLLFQAVRMGGELMNRHAGFSAAENFDPDTDLGAGPMGDLMHLMLVLLFFATDGHHVVLASLSTSFQAIPPGTGGWSPAAQDAIDRGVSESWAVAMVLSFPVLTAVMLLTAVEGVLARTVPQINLMQVSFGVKIVTSVAVLYAALPAAVAFIGLLISRLEPALQGLVLALR